MARLLRCDYCDKLELVSPYSAHATVPYFDEVGDVNGYDEACNECTRIIRDFMLKRRKEMEDRAR